MDGKMKPKFEFAILNIDKPSGPTSFDVSDYVRKKLGLRKTSHFGTLDPKVTGVLPIALNRACKLTGFFIGHDKEYVGIMRLHEDIELNEVKKMIKKKFIGKIKQTPPVKSRVKRQEREREIKKFELLEKKEKDVLFHVECEGGTYIRKLIDDLGRELGCGAHMLELRRTRAGIFDEKDSIKLYGLDDKEKIKKNLVSGEEALKKIFSIVQVKKESVDKLLTGKPIFEKDVKSRKIDKKRFIAFCKDKFIGVYAKNSQANFGATKSKTAPTRREQKNFVGEIGKPLFVYQEIK